MVRCWRNMPEISGNMEFRDPIGAEAQQAWFRSLAGNECYYFIITTAGKDIGLVHLNLFNRQKGSANVGLFIADAGFLGTGAAVAASVLILDFAFAHLELNTVTAKVKNTNATAIHYNDFLGFTLSETLNLEFRRYSLSSGTYSGRRQAIVSLLG